MGQHRLIFALAAVGLALATLALVMGGGGSQVEGLDAAMHSDPSAANPGELPAPSQVPEALAARRVDVAVPTPPARPQESPAELDPTPTLFFSDGSVGGRVEFRLRDRILSTRRENVSVSGRTGAAGSFPEWPKAERELVLHLPGAQVGMRSPGHPFRFELEDGRVQLGVRRLLAELVAPAGSEGRRAVVQLSTRGADGTLRYAQSSIRLGEPFEPVYAEGDDPVRIHVLAAREDESGMDLQGEAVVPLGVATEEPVAILLRPTPRGTLRVTVPEPGAALTLTYRLAGVAPPWNDGWNTHEMGNEYEEPSGRYSLRLGSPELQGTQSEFVPARLRQPIEIWPGQTTEVEVELARAARLTISAAPGRRGTPGKRPGNDERVSFFSIEDGTPFLITLRRNGEPVQTKWRTDSGEEVLSPTAGGATFSSSSLSPGVYDVQFQVRSNGRVGKPVRVELSPGEHAHVEMP